MISSWGVVASVWRWRRLVRELARRDFQARYAGSLLGAAWAVVQPAVHFGLYWVVFDRLLGTRLASGDGVGPFALYLLSGLVPFLALQEMLQRAVSLAQEQAALIRHVNVPVEVLVSGALLGVAARQAVALVLVAAACGLVGTLGVAQLPALALGLGMLLVAGWGVALTLFVVGAFAPDSQQVVAVGSLVALFATPIVYREAAVPAHFRGWFDVNPLTGLVDLFRVGLVGGTLSPTRTTLAAVVTVLCVGAGLWLLQRRAASVRDVV